MRAHGQTKLGFYPLPPAEANRLRSWLNFQEPFSTLDPCAGDGVAFFHLLRNAPARRYGIEIDAYRAEQARTLEIETLQANTMDVRCPADSLSLLYLNPPYDWGGRLHEQPKTRSCLSGPHVSLAQAGRRSALCDSSAAAGEMR